MPHSGYGTLALPGICPPGTLTTEASSMSSPAISAATPGIISLPVSADGNLPCNSPDGLQLDLFGPAVPPASPSPPQASKAEPLTSGISGLGGFGSSASVALTLSLANRLRERLGSDGSIEFSQIWKRKVTPAGRRYWAHTASAHRTSASDCSGWRTPQSMDADRGPAMNADPKAGQHSLTTEAQLAGWPTPNTMAGGQTSRGGDRKDELLISGLVAGWATPTQRDYRHPNGRSDEERGRGSKGPQLANQVAHSGLMPSGSPASTARRGALNPLFSLWLMLGSGDLARAWASCAGPATRSSRRSRPSS